MVFFGLALFMYAARSALSYRDMLKLTQQEFETVPLIIKVEVLIAAVTCMWGSLVVSGDFKPVSALKNQRGLDANMQRVEFMSLNHRGQVMPMVAPAIK